MRMYLAGPVTNGGTISPFDAPARFALAEREVMILGHVPLSPLVVKLEPSATWRDYMVHTIRLLLTCDGAYFLRGWEGSRGARLEHLIAAGLEMTILYQPTDDASITTATCIANRCIRLRICERFCQPHHNQRCVKGSPCRLLNK